MLKAVIAAAFALAAAVAPADAQVTASSLVGSYAVRGTDPDGKRYPGLARRAGRVDITLAPSGALELEWNSGAHVGVGRLVGDVLTVAISGRGRDGIMVMKVNPDGSLSGQWWRRGDRGTRATETWKKMKR